jgi:hypothetical protein
MTMAATNPPTTGTDLTTAAAILAAIEAGTANIYAYSDIGTIQAPGVTAAAIKTLVETNYDRTNTVTVGVKGEVAYYTNAGGVFTQAGLFGTAQKITVERHLTEATNHQYTYHQIMEGTLTGKYIRREDTSIGIVGGI